ncbi:hypothetical protein BV210_02690 [Halorientalis sp. IM1011]|uniref:hypothetical protein n=1 Tax=Halorientalis sp. IM1011 TaxID=1932360 RepID=UPI00097CC414|nr:hypothetical protein [Halorientalis sp. IM1011]AQL41686.1 hypothetical protein BV210_02690 [Halorientalis sp. IM1011]
MAIDGVVRQVRAVLVDQFRIVCVRELLEREFLVVVVARHRAPDVGRVPTGRAGEVTHVRRLSLGSDGDPGVDQPLLFR